MSGMAWLQRRSIGALARRAPTARAQALDAWLETLHGLAVSRTAERAALAKAGHELRSRLRDPR